jgi:hypothetical protein
MKRLSRLVLALAGLCGCMSASAEQIRSGRWGFQVEMVVSGMQGAPSTGPIYYERCLEKLDPAGLAQPVGSPCQLHDVVSGDGEMRWKMRCEAHGTQLSGSGQVRYDNDKIELVQRYETQAPRSMRISQRIAGKYLGICKQPKAPQGEPVTPLKRYPE